MVQTKLSSDLYLTKLDDSAKLFFVLCSVTVSPTIITLCFSANVCSYSLAQSEIIIHDPFKVVAYFLFLINHSVCGKRFLQGDRSSSTLESFVFQRNGFFFSFSRKSSPDSGLAE